MTLASPQPMVAAPFDSARIEMMGDLLDVGVFAVDTELVVRAWNRWLERATGRLSIDVIGLPLRSVVPDLTAFAENALRQATAGAASVLSHRFHRYLIHVAPPSGHESFDAMQQSVRIIPNPGPHGAPIGAIALIEDVTERVAGENELKAALVKAESANKIKANFLASMSHELRTPIGAISGYADLLRDGLFGPVSSDQAEPLLRIKRIAGHLQGIIEEILVFSRLEAGREAIHLTEVDAADLLRNAANAVEPLAHQKGLQLIAHPFSPTPMLADAVKVGQILINLLGNAVKFTPSGSVTLSAEVRGDTISFFVADTGEGIPPDQLDRIFEPFTQVDSELAKRRDGTGLGLAVSRQLARLLGGDITVTSAPGKGSTFVTTLPLRGTAGGG